MNQKALKVNQFTHKIVVFYFIVHFIKLTSVNSYKSNNKKLLISGYGDFNTFK